jgi:hypothetical protein
METGWANKILRPQKIKHNKEIIFNMAYFPLKLL